MNISLIIPHRKSVTGNLVTARRLAQGLKTRGHRVFLNGAEEELPQGREIDIVHSFNALRTVGALSTLRRDRRLPWVVTLTGTDYTLEGNSLGPILSQADRIIVFHEEARSTVESLCPEYLKKLVVIAQGVSILAGRKRELIRQKMETGRDKLVFFVAAGLRPIKNITVVLLAFKELESRYDNLSLWLAGPVLDKEEANKIFELSRQLENFNYLGALEHSELLELYGAADVYINSSRAEGMAGAVLEAMAAEVSVIATDVPGNRNVIDNEKTGLLVMDNDVASLVCAMERLVNNEALRQRLGMAGKRLVEENHDPSEEIDRIEEIYRDLLL